MSDNRLGGLALIIGTAAMLVTMAFHPTAQQITNENYFRMMLLNTAVHSLAIASLPLTFLGALALWRRLDAPGRLALAALITYALAMVAGMCAASISGFVAPNVLHRMWEADAADKKYWDAVSHLGWWMNQAFARVLVLGSSAAILLWSAAMLRLRRMSHGFAVYGAIVAPVVILVVATGHVQLNVHGFGAVVLLQAVWFIAVGRELMRDTPPEIAS